MHWKLFVILAKLSSVLFFQFSFFFIAFTSSMLLPVPSKHHLNGYFIVLTQFGSLQLSV